MPVDPALKTPVAIQEIPSDGTRTVAQLGELLNDRIRQLNQALTKYVKQPNQAAIDLGTQQIVNLADPKNDLDGVNLRTLRKFAGAPVEQQAAKGSGFEQPTIYFEFDGFPFDDEASPFAIIMQNRQGFTPLAISIAAVGPGVSDSVKGNLQIAGVNMLTEDIELPAGEQGPVFSTKLAGGSLALGTLIQAIITQASGSSQVSFGLVIRGNG